MNILCDKFSNALYFIFEGWRQVFINTGHNWRWINQDEDILDVFSEYKPDVFIGATYAITPALVKALRRSPDTKVLMKANNWGWLNKEIDLEQFPIGVATSKEINDVDYLRREVGKPDFVFNFYHINRYDGTMESWNQELGIGLVEGLPAADTFNYKLMEPQEDLKCDIGFVGGYWPYKARNLDKYLIPLCYPVGKYNIKIFGNQPWPVPQYLGQASTNVTEALFASSAICPNISEPHANEFGFEVNERVFKLAATKAFIINDKIASLNEDIFLDNELLIADDPAHFHDLVHMFLNNPQLKDHYVESCYNTVMNGHTYAHRISNIWKQLDYQEESEKCLALIKQTTL